MNHMPTSLIYKFTNERKNFTKHNTTFGPSRESSDVHEISHVISQISSTATCDTHASCFGEFYHFSEKITTLNLDLRVSFSTSNIDTSWVHERYPETEKELRDRWERSRRQKRRRKRRRREEKYYSSRLTSEDIVKEQSRDEKLEKVILSRQRRTDRQRSSSSLTNESVKFDVERPLISDYDFLLGWIWNLFMPIFFKMIIISDICYSTFKIKYKISKRLLAVKNLHHHDDLIANCEFYSFSPYFFFVNN